MICKQLQHQYEAQYQAKRENYKNLGLLIDTVASGLSAPTSSGLGIATATLSPAASYKIGQYFKAQANNNPNGQLTSGQEAAHILAHTVLGAAVAAAGGNNALTAGLSARGAEAAAPLLSSFLYGKEAKDLTAEQKSTISSIVGLTGTALGATTGDVATTVQSGQVAQNAVENNEFFKVNDEGDWLSCAPRQGERAATEQDIRNGAINIAIDVATGTIVGRAVKVVKNGYQIADKVFKNVKDANKAIDNSALSIVQKQQLKEQLAQQAGIPRDIVNNPASLWGKR
ncbi:VENN motif pre-toxin domain-containing protein [Acinetobacter soli]|nr:VENN motif pre-toxin domain-containing protein [Acinetobacter soli]WOQ35581.1 VENN motif pre-toxin domain-containing protein [Acinetobacter soli]